MTLSCNWDYEGEPGDTVWYSARDFSTYNRKRSCKCCSCGARIANGDECAEFPRFKIPESDIEIAIHGEDGEVPRASWYMCERCAGLYFSLADLGFAINIYEDMHDVVKEYADTYGPAAPPDADGCASAQPSS